MPEHRPLDRCAIMLVDPQRIDPGIDLDRLQRVIDAALADDGQVNTSLTVLLVDDGESARLHAAHFSDPEPTDVMTFPDGTVDPESGRTHLGDLAIGIDVARRAADERGRAIGDELILYALHGVLHLLGYDDADERDLAQMWPVQRRLLAGVGIALEAEPS
jgi:probable rRNA maturation factor